MGPDFARWRVGVGAELVRVALLLDRARLFQKVPRVVQEPAAAAVVGQVTVKDPLRGEGEGTERIGRVRVRARVTALFKSFLLLLASDAETVGQSFGRRKSPAAAALKKKKECETRLNLVRNTKGERKR